MGGEGFRNLSQSISWPSTCLPVYQLFIHLSYSVIPYCVKTNFPFYSLIPVESVLGHSFVRRLRLGVASGGGC